MANPLKPIIGFRDYFAQFLELHISSRQINQRKI